MRGKLDVETLLQIILVLVIVWLALEVISLLFATVRFILGPFAKLFGLAIIVLIVLWYFDRI